MKQYPFFSKLVFALAFTAVVIGFSAFSQKSQKGNSDSFRKEQFSENSDTGRSGKCDRDRSDWNFDKLDEQMLQLDMQMKNLDIQMKNFELSQLPKQIDNAMKQIDVEKINKQLKESIENIDWENINNRLSENVNASQLKLAEVKKEMEQVRANLEKQKIDIKINAGKIKADIEKSMKSARKSIENAKEELKNMREFTDALQKDGLIDKSKAYKIEVKNNELYIDGKKQSKEISDKYRQYYRESDFTINTSEEDEVRI